jgi:hypothetical protein
LGKSGSPYRCSFRAGGKVFCGFSQWRKVPTVRAYIKNKQAHHANVTFAEEFNHFQKGAGYNI